MRRSAMPACSSTTAGPVPSSSYAKGPPLISATGMPLMLGGTALGSHAITGVQDNARGARRVRGRDVAGGGVPRSQFAGQRRDRGALVDRERAAPAEAASGGGVDDPGRL